MDQLTVVGGGFAGLVAAISAAEAGSRVTLYEAHRTLGGRARTAPGPYRTNEGPHALYNGGPHWTWLAERDLIGPLARVPLAETLRLRVHRNGRLGRMPSLALLRLARRPAAEAPVDQDFHSWAAPLVGERAARQVANFLAVALFHHDVGALSAAFVQERLIRVAKFPPEAQYPRGGWQSVVDRMAAQAVQLGVRIETGARVDTLPTATGPVVVATSLAAARSLLGDASLTWESGRTVLLDLGLTARRGDPWVVSDLDAPAWLERFTGQDPGLAPAGRSLVQGQLPIAPGQSKTDGVQRAERLLDLGFRGWRERVAWRRESVATGRTGAVDLPGTTWRDRPAVNRGDGVYLAGDQVAAPGVLSEVSFNSALEAVSLALRTPARTSTRLHR
ncbi:FAD-dependent oxidoreductase [Streptomyces bambusae]|uniref:FAD-dependent oxidoreductase n=1 Tax=Streptomyces bambusae TaxID=1550616 RepID=A0ABS6ZAY4_9ACTN|nr:FAD-dependent oxidoreductase [Streptomyces bambusae]MBW5484584.1 FAD-dependent oxidoreductase [Streptomyces bambusae]